MAWGLGLPAVAEDWIQVPGNSPSDSPGRTCKVVGLDTTCSLGGGTWEKGAFLGVA